MPHRGGIHITERDGSGRLRTLSWPTRYRRVLAARRARQERPAEDGTFVIFTKVTNLSMAGCALTWYPHGRRGALRGKTHATQMTKSMKRQKMIVGSFIKIPLTENRFVLGKILKKSFVVVYQKVINISELQVIDFSTISVSGELLYGTLFNDVITKGVFEIIQKSSVSEEELKRIHPRFNMETAHPELCTILYGDDSEKKALPSQCIGLDYLYIWDAPSFIELIEDRLTGRPNKYEKQKKERLEQGIAIEKELGMSIPWEWWKPSLDTGRIGYDSLLEHPPTEWQRIVGKSDYFNRNFLKPKL